MIGAGIFPGDYVFVKRQQTANEGDLVIALFDGKNNLKKFGFDPKNKKYILHSCNPNTVFEICMRKVVRKTSAKRS